MNKTLGQGVSTFKVFWRHCSEKRFGQS